MVTDWARYELKHGEAFDSTVWTNIVFRIEGLNSVIGKRVGQEIDVSKYIHFCDSSFFNDPEKVFWLEKFPAKSVIIIDEVHFYLGKTVEYGSLDLEQALINWISTHRHQQQEIYFLTQHTDQFARQILGIADKLLEIVNMKSMILPFPFSVPFQDIYDLKASFGIKTQYYQANVGNFRGKAVSWSGTSQRCLMSPDIFSVYKSHDAGVEESDRPSLKMTPVEGLLWFARRHGWHLAPKILGVILLPYILLKVLLGLPMFLMNAAAGEKTPTAEVAPPAVVKNIEIPDPPKAIPPGPTKTDSSIRSTTPPAAPLATRKEEPVPVRPEPLPAKRAKLVMLFNGGVILDDGSKIKIGEKIDYDGKTETLADACAICGVIVFESGKRIRF